LGIGIIQTPNLGHPPSSVAKADPAFPLVSSEYLCSWIFLLRQGGREKSWRGIWV
jgi:hypothetical protein